TRRGRLGCGCGRDRLGRDRRSRAQSVRKGSRVSNDNPEEQQFRPPATDPWKGFRGVMAGTLVLEAIVVLLVLPVIATVGGGLSAWSTTYVVGLAVVMILGAGLQKRPWAIPFNLALQVLAILGFFVDLAFG